MDVVLENAEYTQSIKSGRPILLFCQVHRGHVNPCTLGGIRFQTPTTVRYEEKAVGKHCIFGFSLKGKA